MPKFRKKPVIVYAEQYTGPLSVGTNEPMPTGWAGVQWQVHDNSGERFPYVVTAHGQKAFLAPDDWIICEPDGRGFYPCKPDIFAATYEPVEE